MKRLRTSFRYCIATALAAPLVAGLLFFGGADTAKAYSGYQFPCSGYGVTGYSFAQYVSGWGHHVAEDVCNQAGRPVYAAADGVVMYSAKTPDSYRWGNLILIQQNNGDGSETTGIYGHLSNDRRVAAGQSVSKGQLIGFVGPSWTSENGNWSAHLHFGLRTGPYGSPVGTYNPGIVGYLTSGVGNYAHPTNYVNGRQVVHDYQVAGVDGSGTYSQNAEYYVEFRLRNTGSTTWNMNGPAPMRLGTINQRDRGSAFANGMIGHGWAAPSRIALMQDTPPGGIGVFRARFNNRYIPPGVYAERFAPVIEGERWLADRDLWVQINVQPPQYRAQWVGQNVFADHSPTNTVNPQDSRYLTPGKKMNAKVYLKNVGDIAWTSSGPNPTRLGTVEPKDRPSAVATGGDSSIPQSENWPYYTRPSGIDGRLDPGSNTITPTDTIQPGEIAVFSFTITAPNQPGEYIEYFNPLVENVKWMNYLGLHFRFRVLPPGYHYEWAGQQDPAPIQLGRTSSNGYIDLKNSGQSQWATNSAFRLGTWNSRDRESAFAAGWMSPSRVGAISTNVSNPNDPIIHPGQVARFNFNVQAYSPPNGFYPESVRPLVENEQWLPEDYGMSIPTTVTAPERDYQVVSQRFSRSVDDLKYGDEVTATMLIRNLGTEAWPTNGPNPTRIGTERLRDRQSGFKVLSGGDPWLSPTRPSAIDGIVTNLNPVRTQPTSVVSQGQIGYFTFPLKVPEGIPAGTYNEYFSLLREDRAWWPDLGVYFPLTITGD